MSATALCSCCGVRHDEADLDRLQRRADVAVCGDCLARLVGPRRTVARVMPVLPSADVAASMAFWAKAGFEVAPYSGDFAFAFRDGFELHLVGAVPESRDRGAAYLHVHDVDAVHAAWSAAGLPVSELADQSWGMREFHVVDPGGNRVRVGHNR